MNRYVFKIRHPKGSGFPTGRYGRVWKTRMKRKLGADYCEYIGNPVGTFLFIAISDLNLSEFREIYADVYVYDLEGERVSRKRYG